MFERLLGRHTPAHAPCRGVVRSVAGRSNCWRCHWAGNFPMCRRPIQQSAGSKVQPVGIMQHVSDSRQQSVCTKCNEAGSQQAVGRTRPATALARHPSVARSQSAAACRLSFASTHQLPVTKQLPLTNKHQSQPATSKRQPPAGSIIETNNNNIKYNRNSDIAITSTNSCWLLMTEQQKEKTLGRIPLFLFVFIPPLFLRCLRITWSLLRPGIRVVVSFQFRYMRC